MSNLAPTWKVFFLKRKVEKRSFPGKKMMWSGLPMTEIEFQFENLFLVEVRYLITEPLQQVLGSTIDAYKWTLVRHLDEVFRFRLLKRHFQFQLYITHDETWHRVSYSSTMEEELNRYQERTRLPRYCLRLKLNPGITPTNCGRP